MENREILEKYDHIGETILADVEKNYKKGEHPRLIVTDERMARILALRETSAIMKSEVDALIAACDRILDEPLCHYEIADGIRLLPVSRGIEHTVIPLMLAFRITKDEKYADRAWRQLELAANFKDWNQSHFLDVAELALTFGLAYDWLYGWLTDERKSILRSALIRHAFIPVMDDYKDRNRYRTYRWYQHKPGDNWKLVCDGSISIATMAVFDDLPDRDMANTMMTCAFKDAYEFVRDAYVSLDGTYTESMTYWTYATDFLSYYHTALMTAAGQDYGLTDHDGLRKTSRYIKGLMSNGCKSFNYGDAPEIDMVSPVFLWVGELFDRELAMILINRMAKGQHAYRHLYWYDGTEPAPLTDGDLDYATVGSENASFRDGWDVADSMFAAIHYGDNGVPHAHSDTGEFIVELNGKRFFSDLGPDNYNIKPYRATYRYRAEGHNTLVVNPSEEIGQIEPTVCRIQKYVAGRTSYVVGDISVAYGETNVVRGFRMDRDAGTVTVQDEIACKASDVIYWFAHTPAAIDLSADGRSAALTIDGTVLHVACDGDGIFTVAEALPMPTSPNPDGQAKNDFKKLAIRLTGKDVYTVSVTFSRTAGAHEVKPITAW